MTGGTGPREAAQPDGNHFSCSLTAVLISRVRRLAGEEGVAQLLALASSSCSLNYLEDIGNWVSYEEAMALFKAGSEITADAHFARHVGADTVSLLGASSNATVLRALGSPEKLLEHMGEASHRFSTAADLEAIEVRPGYAEIRAAAAPGFRRDEMHCDWTAGLLTQSTVLFGLKPATVQHDVCQAQGAADCRYLLSWKADAAHEVDPDEQIASLQEQLDAMSGRLQSVFATAADLIASGDLDQTLARITERAALQVRAPRYLLAVRPTPGAPFHWHQQGLDDEECRRIAEQVLADDPQPFPDHWLVAPVKSHRNHYGSIVAMHRPGASFFSQERQILEVYARYAAAALDSAASLAEANARQQEAQSRYEESRALLDLARRLATAGSSDEIAQRLADAVPAVVDCDRVGVFVWEEVSGELVRRAVKSSGTAEEGPGLRRIRPQDVPQLQRLIEHPDSEPLFLDFADSVLLEDLRRLGVVGCVGVPIATSERLLGGLVVSVFERPERLELNPELCDRLSGVAAHAVTALENGRLVDHITHQASHDQLTGLLNRMGFGQQLSRVTDQARQAKTPLGLYYVDLDGFKRVNDEYGHDVGDQLLGAVANRLLEEVRPADIVARLGGDEFVVLVEDIENQEQLKSVTKRLDAAFEQPFSACGYTFTLTASIGRAIWPTEVSELDALLRQADASMYEQKRALAPRVVANGALR